MRLNRHNVAVTVWCGGYVECTEDPEDMCALHHIASERDDVRRSLKEVDDELECPWNSTRRIREIRKLKRQADAAHQLLTAPSENEGD